MNCAFHELTQLRVCSKVLLHLYQVWLWLEICEYQTTKRPSRSKSLIDTLITNGLENLAHKIRTRSGQPFVRIVWWLLTP